jgi:uncharacterized lipoprotein
VTLRVLVLVTLALTLAACSSSQTTLGAVRGSGVGARGPGNAQAA